MAASSSPKRRSRAAGKVAAGHGRLPDALAQRFRRIKLLLCDVDGVLTDATVSVGPGIELKRFCVRDGLAHRFVRDMGLQVGWISNRPSTATAQRAEELQIDYLVQERVSKVTAAGSLLERAKVTWDEVAFLGDDLVDLGLLRKVGLAVAVQNAIPEVKAVAHFVTRTPGGAGAFREVVDEMLRARGRWEDLCRTYAEG